MIQYGYVGEHTPLQLQQVQLGALGWRYSSVRGLGGPRHRCTCSSWTHSSCNEVSFALCGYNDAASVTAARSSTSTSAARAVDTSTLATTQW